MRLLRFLSSLVVVAASGFSPFAPAVSAPASQIGTKWKAAIATVFWVGEGPAPDNGFISNVKGAWDENWVESFGGVDQPHSRCGFLPCAFKPKENAFYVALPYDDLTEYGLRKRNASVVPWNRPGARTSVLKNRWIAVQARDVVCYGQWQDVGPFEHDDAAYVFGAAPEPSNRRGVSAGIDLSPAMRDCLGVGHVSRVMWRHVEAVDVPDGPWKEIVTTRRGP
jgi:hypothetical protein